MASALVAGHMLMASASAFYALYRILRPYRVGIYGPSMVGKTTLDQYLTVPGDIDPIPYEMRTAHAKADNATGFRSPRSTRKQVRLVKEKKPIRTTDLAGDPMFRNLWIEDMFGRDVELVIFMIDHRAMIFKQFAMDASASLSYLVDNMTKKDVSKNISRKAKKKSKKYTPKLFCLMINKMDLWWDHQAARLWQLGLQKEHPIVAPFRESLKRLRKAGIRAEVMAMSSQHGINVQKNLIELLDSL
tara:strand:+ start:3805 stop:4539 length:735 start_codon:yes stop_codon:yes gene_type:complete